MDFPFALQPISENEPAPIWKEGFFILGKKKERVLRYSENTEGWDDHLTKMHEENLSDNHPIDRASREHAIQQIKKFNKVKHPVILEVGCSSGYLIKDLKKHFSDAFIIGVDVIREKLNDLAAADTDVPFMQFDLTQCALPDRSIDVLVMLNVLEHIERDDQAVVQAYRILKPGGILVIELPAGPHLYDVYDKFLHHYRRYDLFQLESLLVKTGFKTVYKSHLGFFLYPFFYWSKKKNQKYLAAPAVEQEKIGLKAMTQTKSLPLFKEIMKLELLLGRIIKYPRGIRCLITCRK